MTNPVFEEIEHWRLNNKLSSLHKTKILLECYIQTKLAPSIGVNSRFIINLLPTESARVTRVLKPSFHPIPRSKNAHSLTSRGKELIFDIDHGLQLRGLTWDKAVQFMVNKYIDSITASQHNVIINT